MLAGYADWVHAWHVLEWRAVDLWYGSTDTVARGLRFGLEDAGIDAQLRQLGLSGTIMLFDNAVAAAAGEWMSAEPTPKTTMISSSRSATLSWLLLDTFVPNDLISTSMYPIYLPLIVS